MFLYSGLTYLLESKDKNVTTVVYLLRVANSRFWGRKVGNKENVD